MRGAQRATRAPPLRCDSRRADVSRAQAPDWTPSLQRFGEDDMRTASLASHVTGAPLSPPFVRSKALLTLRFLSAVRGAVAVPVFLGRGAAERAVAVLEAVYTSELLSVADAISSLLAALSAAGLHPSCNRSFAAAPAPPTQQQAAAAQRLAGVAEALCGQFELPLAQLWLAGSAPNDRSAHRGDMTPLAGAVPRLRSRGAPGVTRVPAAWAMRAACAERALAPREGLPGAAWAAGAAVWVAARAALARTAEPLRPYHALFGADGGALAVPVAPTPASAAGIIADDIAPEAPGALVLELQLPPAMAGAAQLALLARLLPALESACAAAGLTAAVDASPDAVAAMEAMARRAGMSRPPAAFVAAPPGAATSDEAVLASFMEPWLSRLPGTKAVPGIAAVFFALAGAPSAQRAPPPASAPRSSAAAPPETPALDAAAPDAAAPPATDAAPPAAASHGDVDDEWQPCGEDLDGAGADGITMAQLRSVFTFPLKEAARRLNVCGTTLKCVCRKHGIARWPYRTLAKLSSNAVKLKHSVESIGVAHPQAAAGEPHRRPAPRPAGWGTPVGALRPLAQAAHMQVRRSARAAAKPQRDGEEAAGSEFDEDSDAERAAEEEEDADDDDDPFASDGGGSKRRGGGKRKRGQAAPRRRAGGADGSESDGDAAQPRRKARPAPLVHEDSTMAAMLTELRGGDAAAVFAAAEAAARTPRPPPGTVKPKSRSGVRRPQPPVAAAAPPAAKAPAAKAPPPPKVPTAKPKARRIVPAPPMPRAAAVPASPVATALASPPAGLLPLASPPPQFALARFPLPAPVADTGAAMGAFGSSPHARAMLPPAGVYGGTPLFAPSPRRGAAVAPGSAPSSGGSGSGGEGGNVAAMWALPDFTSLWSATPGWPGGLAASPAAAGAGAAWAASLPALFATPAPPQQQQGGGR